MKKEDEIENLFSSEFEDFSVTPPIELKKSIDRKIFISKVKFGLLLLGVFVISLSSIWYFYNSNSEMNDKFQNQSYSVTKVSNESKFVVKSNSKLAKNTSSISSIKSKFNSKENNLENKAKSNNSFLNKEKQNEKSKKVLFDDSLLGNNLNSDSKQINKKTVRKSKSKKSLKSGSIIELSKVIEPVNQNNSSDKLLSENLSITSNSDKGLSNDSLKKDDIKSNERGDNSNSKIKNEIIDSIENQSQISNIEKAQIDSNNQNELKQELQQKWEIAYRFGTGFAMNTFLNQNEFSLTEKKTISTSIELKKYLNRQYSIASGLQFEQNTSYFNFSVPKADSSFIGFDTTFTPILDSNGATSGYTTELHPKYQNSTSLQSMYNNYNVTNFSIPISFGFSKSISNNFVFEINSGIIGSFQKSKLITTDLGYQKAVINKFGMKVFLRPQIKYQINQFGVSLSTNFGYDFSPTLNWSTIQKRRYYSSFSIGFHYNF